MNRAQIESMNPSALRDIARAWTDLGNRVEDLFDRYVAAVDRVEGDYWEGAAAEAAQNRARADRTTAIALADRLFALAGTADAGFFEVDAPLRRARAAVQGAETDGFAVADDLRVTDPHPSDDRAAPLLDWQREVGDAARCVADADRSVRDSLAGHRDILRAAFIDVAGLGADQGRADAAALTSGELDPQQRRRLVEAGGLTAEQYADLAAGGTTTIPVSQMEYLNRVARELDGLGPREVEGLLDTLPPEERAGLANALQLVSNPDILTTVAGDPDVPRSGGRDLLPTGIRESLTRDDLVVHGVENLGGRLTSGIALNGVDDNRAIAQIAEAADPRTRTGTDLDRDLLDVGRRYLDAQVAHEQNPDSTFEYFTVDGSGTGDPRLTEDIFTAVADDKQAILDVVSDDDGARFVENLLVHDWPDDGAAAAHLFSFTDDDAAVTDPNDRTDVGSAVVTEEVMEKVARHVSTPDAWEALSNVTGTDNLSAGQLNPELIRTLSHSLSPYIPDLAGANSQASPAFDRGDDRGWSEWIDPSGRSNYSGAANVFALMSTDATASDQFVSAAWDHQLAAEAAYAADPDDPQATRNLGTAGVLMGLVDKGLYLGAVGDFRNEAEQAQAVYDRKSDAYDFWKGIGGGVVDPLSTGAAITALVDAGGDSLKEAFIGPEPSPREVAALTGSDLSASYHRIVSALPTMPPEIVDSYPNLFENNVIRSYDDLSAENVQRQRWHDDVRAVFSRIGDPADGHSSVMNESYSNVVRFNG